jgi:large subunit ribosomal protein L17
MNHHIAGRKLGRTTDHKLAMLRNLVTSLITHDKLTTTEAKAKELRRIADRMITLGKKGNLAAIRKAAQTVRTKEALGKLFNDLAPLFAGRNGGYTRIIRYKNRHGDHAPMAIIEWTESTAVKEPEKKAADKKGTEKKAAEKKTVEKKTSAKKSLEKKAAPKKKPAEKKAEKNKAAEDKD